MKALVWEDDGDHDHELGRTMILTPNYTHTRGGYGVAVAIEYLPEAETTWKESQVVAPQGGAFHDRHLIVRAEDGYDKDWSDTF